MDRAHVLVIGAGPVGVVAAYRLALSGIDVILLEADAHCREDMRASTLHPPTIAMLAELGVLDTLEAEGLRAPIYHYRNRRAGAVVALDLTDIADLTPYPYRLQCEQFKVSRLLSELLDKLPNGTIHFSRRVISLQQEKDHVIVTTESPSGIETYRADYVIAADGASSVCRKLLEVPFDGFTYPEKFLTLSTDYPIDELIPDIAYVNYVADPEEWCVLLRVPLFWRMLVPAAESDTDAALLSDDRKTEIFAGLIGKGPARDVRTGHRTIYRVHQRVARSFRSHRVLLAGDAAHLNNPLGGFGLNAGVHDAWNLTEKLLEIFAGHSAPDALLDLYDRQRRTVMNEFVQSQTIQNKRALEAGSAEAQADFQRRLETISLDDDLRRDYLATQAMIKSLERAGEIT